MYHIQKALLGIIKALFEHNVQKKLTQHNLKATLVCIECSADVNVIRFNQTVECNPIIIVIVCTCYIIIQELFINIQKIPGKTIKISVPLLLF